MAVTQIVSLSSNKEVLQRSLQKISTDKIVFVTRKDKLKDTLSIRNEFALSYKLPTEVKILSEDMAEVLSELKKQENAILHIIEHDDLNYYLINASFLLGMPVYFSDGEDMQVLPGPLSKFKDMLSPDQIKIIDNLKEECTHAELSLKTKLDNSLLFYYLYGKNSHIGLIKFGLVTDNSDRLKLTDFGRLIVGS